MAASTGPTRSAAGKPLQLLIADDDSADLELCIASLRKFGVSFHAETAANRDVFVQKLCDRSYDLVLSDFRMKGWTGMDALALLRNAQPEVPLILLTGALGDELAVECIKNGVADYVLKSQLSRLPLA